MHFDLTWIIALRDFVQGIIAAVGGVGGIAVAHKLGLLKFLVKVVEQLWNDRARYIKDADVIAKGLAEVSPAVAQVEQSVADEVAKVTAELRQTQLYKVATVGLHAFGVAVSALSPDQRKALSYFISSHVEGVTQAEIDAALAFVQKETDDAAQSPVFVAANAYTKAGQSA